MSKEITPRQNKVLNPQYQAKLQKALDLGKSIVESSANLSVIEMGISIKDTLSKPTLRGVFKDESAQVCFAIIRVLVTRFLDSFAFSTKLNETQKDSLTVDLLEAFAYESLEDVILFLKMARSGKLGVAKKGIDSNTILGDWFPKYLEQKAIAREDNYNNEKSMRNSKSVSAEVVKNTYKRIDAKAYLIKVQQHIDYVTKDMDRQMLEDLIVDWQNDPERRPYIDMLKRKRRTIK